MCLSGKISWCQETENRPEVEGRDKGLKGVERDEDRIYEGAKDYNRESGLGRDEMESSRAKMGLGGRMWNTNNVSRNTNQETQGNLFYKIYV